MSGSCRGVGIARKPAHPRESPNRSRAWHQPCPTGRRHGAWFALPSAHRRRSTSGRAPSKPSRFAAGRSWLVARGGRRSAAARRQPSRTAPPPSPTAVSEAVEPAARLAAACAARASPAALSGHAVIVKRLSLPAMSQAELGDAIPWEAEQYIPFDLSEVQLDYQVVNAGDRRRARTSLDVLLVAAKRDRIDDRAGVIAQTGRRPVVIDIEAFALANAYQMNYPERTDPLVGAHPRRTQRDDRLPARTRRADLHARHLDWRPGPPRRRCCANSAGSGVDELAAKRILHGQFPQRRQPGPGGGRAARGERASSCSRCARRSTSIAPRRRSRSSAASCSRAAPGRPSDWWTCWRVSSARRSMCSIRSAASRVRAAAIGADVVGPGLRRGGRSRDAAGGRPMIRVNLLATTRRRRAARETGCRANSARRLIGLGMLVATGIGVGGWWWYLRHERTDARRHASRRPRPSSRGSRTPRSSSTARPRARPSSPSGWRSSTACAPRSAGRSACSRPSAAACPTGSGSSRSSRPAASVQIDGRAMSLTLGHRLRRAACRTPGFFKRPVEILTTTHRSRRGHRRSSASRQGRADGRDAARAGAPRAGDGRVRRRRRRPPAGIERGA